jgi:hypothetical protein
MLVGIVYPANFREKQWIPTMSTMPKLDWCTAIKWKGKKEGEKRVGGLFLEK